MSNPFQNVIASSTINGTWFGFYTSEEIKQISVKKIISPISIDELGTYVKDGLYDPIFGPQSTFEVCENCNLVYDYCPGHAGHIELATPVYHPILFNIFYKIFRSICFNCHKIRMKPSVIDSYIVRFRLLASGRLKEAIVYLNSGDIAQFAKLLTELIPEYDEFTENVDSRNLKNDNNIKKNKKKKQCGDAIRNLIDKSSLVSNVVVEKKNLIKSFFAESNSTKICNHCSAYNPPLRKDKATKIFQAALTGKEFASNKEINANVTSLGNKPSSVSGNSRYITTSEAKDRMIRFFNNENDLVHELFKAVFPTMPGVIKKRVDPNMFFCEVLLVPPSRFRPAAKGAMGDMEHPQNVYFKKILNINHQLYQIESLKDKEDPLKLYQKMIDFTIELQDTVNKLMSNDSAANGDPPGIKQLLEKKQGLFRKHMMGKRVNFAARSVISPDPYINSNQIGVPEVFAKKLTFPTPVTDWNYNELCERVINGPDIHPGANMIEDDRGFKIILKGGDENYESRVAASRTLLTQKSSNSIHKKSTIVYRHLQDGDLIIMNRQPTLHKPSMMSHRALVQKNERVIRMHYANCKTFNADFDGDEMNMHFPQTQLARADAQEIMFSDRQYITPTNGGPLRGLIQDHVVSGVLLTKRDTFFTREEFQQLFYSTVVNIEHILVMPEPCIIKPQKLWTGKQLISAILKHLTKDYKVGLNLTSKSQVSSSMWANDEFEQIVTFRNGELLTGVLDKSQFGAASYGLVHCSYELYGPTMAGLLISTLGRLFTIHLQFHGFTCGIDDLIITKKGNIQRSARLTKSDIHGLAVATEFSKYDSTKHPSLTDALRETLLDDSHFAKLDTLVKTKVNQLTTEIISECIPSQQMKQFPKNFMALMTLSGAKGSQVNVSQISCLLGQQELEGRRVPVMASGKTLPSFLPYDTRARAGGYIGDRFLTGIRPQEYFFHCMAGREGLVDTAVKTSNSGYLQRCLIKHLEDLVVAYDYTVRDADGSVMQFNFGDDCIDTLNTKFLTKFDFLAANTDTLKKTYNLQSVKQGSLKIQPIINYHKKREQYKKEGKTLDPMLSMLNPSTNFGCISEGFEKSLTDFIKSNPIDIFTKSKQTKYNSEGLKKISKEDFRALMLFKYRRSIVHPGESVGVVASQSIGEPSTQMTLNSVDWNETVYVRNGNNVILGPIGQFVDDIIDNSSNIKYYENETEYVDISNEGYQVTCVDEDGKMHWKPLIAVTRHLPGGNMVKVTTQSGRTVTATKSKSFLVRMNNKIVPKKGSDIVIGDRLPIVINSPSIKDELYKLDMVKYFPKEKECFYGSEMKIPEFLVLDELSGFLFGAYLAEGSITDNCVIISNNDQTYFEKIDFFCARYEIQHGKTFKGETTEYKIHSKLLGKLLNDTCSNSALNKQIPGWSLIANIGFVKGLLDGYFSGNAGTINKRDNVILTSSTSKKLIFGISELCMRFGIFGKILHKTKSTNISSKIQHVHTFSIRNNNATIFANNIKLTHKSKRIILDSIINKEWSEGRGTYDVIPGMNTKLYKGDVKRRVIKSAMCDNLDDEERTLLELAYNSDVYFDEILSIEELQSSHKKVYDFSVKDTLNFTIFGGLCVRDTFHLAGHGGANVTLGIPRLREIVMTATPQIKTPMMTLPLKDGTTEVQAYDLANQFYRLSLPELLQEITVTEALQDTSAGVRVRTYNITLFLHDDEYLEEEHSLKFNEFSDLLAQSFIPALHAAIIKEIKSHCADISAFQASQTLPNSNINEESATESQLRAKKKEIASYDDDEDDEDNVINSILGLLDDDEEEVEEHNNNTIKKKNTKNQSNVKEKQQNKIPSSKVKIRGKKDTSKLRSLRYLKTYSCDNKDNKITISLQIPASNKKLLMVSLVERVADNYIVNSIENIQQAYIEHKEGKYSIITNGVNIQEIWKFDSLIDVNNIKCNHIHKIQDIYGIEAARGCIINEIQSVFGAYGIKVDPRHLSLVSDYMTFTGKYKACNRVHMDSKASPWQKMSFETTMKFLSETALCGGFDAVRSPSACIVVGNPTRVGSGFIDIRHPLV